jgi:hypothetical protein
MSEAVHLRHLCVSPCLFRNTFTLSLSFASFLGLEGGDGVCLLLPFDPLVSLKKLHSDTHKCMGYGSMPNGYRVFPGVKAAGAWR